MKATGPPATPNVLDLDHELAGHAEHLQYRWDNYVNFRREIEQNEGGLAQFASCQPLRGALPVMQEVQSLLPSPPQPTLPPATWHLARTSLQRVGYEI